MIQVEDQHDGHPAPEIELINMQLESSFEMATFSLAALEAMSYPARGVVATQSEARALVFGHWKNFKIHFLFFQDIEPKPYKRTISLLKRLRALLGKDVPIHVKLEVERHMASKRQRVVQKVLPVSFANFYLAMLYRDIKSGKV